MSYEQFKHQDFLLDDFFIQSMLHPSIDSEKYWKDLIDDEEIDIDEFISAYVTIKEINKLKPTIENENLEKLWSKIENTNRLCKRKKKHLRLYSFFSYAAIFAGIIFSLHFNLTNHSEGIKPEPIEQFVSENLNDKIRNDNQIKITNSAQTIKFDGTEANIKYDDKGNMISNEKILSSSKKHTTSIENNFNQISVPFGKRANLTLSDGTVLWINTGTRVIYPSNFSSRDRIIYVEGEVYAEVKHDKKRPFIIKTNQLDVKVLGTVFNISAYKEDKQTNVVLVNGSVGVTPKNGKTTYIKPNQLLSYNEQAMTLRNVDVENYISWRDGIYIFKNEPIEDILIKLSRYYNVTIKLPETASGITCSGKLELKDDLDDLLNGLTEITPMNYGVKDNVYRVSFQ